MDALPRAVRWSPAVAVARRDRAVVALESSVLAQGLPIPANREADHRMRLAVVAHGAVPAVVALVRGEATIGLEGEDLERFLRRDGVIKVSARDLGWAAARGLDGATTVAATLELCTVAGLEVVATGGIGGVHREPAYDESADLLELSRSPVITVCAGAKSILDLPATLERLESYGVAVIGFGTDEFPGFLSRGTGLRLAAFTDDPAEIARAFRAHRRLGGNRRAGHHAVPAGGRRARDGRCITAGQPRAPRVECRARRPHRRRLPGGRVAPGWCGAR
ncbi:MAG TPA: pseudouridine-5'-phosphate glycosidase [Gemmatimonadaceae bacterium]